MDAAVTEPAIQVHAMLRLNSQSSEWKWVHCLTIPLPILSSFHLSPPPYKWIRYAIGVVVGAYGELSFNQDSLDMDYNHPLPLESTTVYYHVNDDERARMFPADPNINRTQVTSEVSTPRRSQFHDEVVLRDTECVFTGHSAFGCDSAHLLPHSKGDEYIATYTQHRSRDPADIVADIDDPRNGILVNKLLHTYLGVDVAVLMTPNFAIRTTDIDPTAPQDEKRCTAHVFAPELSHLFYAFHQGSLVRMPNPPDSWPPGILFDAVYASAVLHHFATQLLREAQGDWEDTFYPEGTSQAEAQLRKINDERAAQNAKKIQQTKARDQRASERQKRRVGGANDHDYFGFLMVLPNILIPRDELEAYQQEAEEKKAEQEHSRVTDKVLGWTREVAEASYGIANPEESYP